MALRRFAMAALACAVSAAPARAEFLIGAGDTLEVTVFRVPELSRRATVDPDGNIAFPHLGAVRAAGLGLEEFRTALSGLLASKDLVRQPDVSVELTGMRPITINGDVSKPGEYPFRAMLTLRQAVAIAGGYDLLRFRSTNPPLELPDLRAEQAAVSLELTRQLVRAALSAAALGENSAPKLPDAAEVSLPHAAVAQIIDGEKRELLARAQTREAEKQAVTQLITHADEQIAALNEQRREDEANVQQLTADATQARSLLERGLSNIIRVQDAQRIISLSRSRLFEGIANIALAWRGREDLQRQLGRIDEEYRLNLIKAASDAAQEARKLRARQDASEEKLLYVGALRSYLRQRAGGNADLVVWRWDGTRQVRIAADEGTVLQPGDAVEVALRVERDAAGGVSGAARQGGAGAGG